MSTPTPDRPGALPAAASIGLLLLLAVGLPLLSWILAGGQGFVAHPHSELPNRLFCLDFFADHRFFGDLVPDLGHPHPGTLNNNDPVGTVVVAALRPLLGLAGAWNALVVLLLAANMLATRAFVRAWLGDERAALTAALGVGLMPLALTYGVASSIVDTLNLWPYPLALWALLRAHRGRAPLRHGALAGLAGAAGLVSSPYVFVVLLAAVPPALLLLLPQVLQVGRDRILRRRWALGLLGLVLVGGALGGGYLVELQQVMDSPGSQVATDYVSSTRNAPPWDELRPGHPAQRQAYLAEYLAIGDGALLQRDTASHYLRTMTPTLTVLVLAVLGTIVSRRPEVRAWLGIAVVATLASTGPFLAVTPALALDAPLNPFFHYVFRLAPGGGMILETFRYGTLAAIGLVMVAAAGVAWLGTRGKTGRILATLAPGLLLAEVLVLSPVPMPLPVAPLQVDEAYHHLDEVLPAGPIVELPFTEGDSGRFARIHMLNQRTHLRPIPDQVRGALPAIFEDNPLLRTLVAAESLQDPVLVDGVLRQPLDDGEHRPYRRLRLVAPPRATLPRGRAELVGAGFVGIVIDPQAYSSEHALQTVLDRLGPGTVELGGRLVHPLR